MTVYMVPAHRDHIWPLLEKAEESSAGLVAAHGESLYRQIADGIRYSTLTWAAVELSDQRLEVLAIGGVRPICLLAGTGLAWQICGPGVKRHKKRFLKESLRLVGEMHAIYPHLIAEVVSAVSDDRWLAWLGWRVTAEFTLNGVPMRRIERRLHGWQVQETVH